MIDLNKGKKNIQKYLIILFIVLALSIVVFIMIKYSVEGEKNIPFRISRLMTVSSAETENLELIDNVYQANIIQKNDIYLAIEKNNNYKKQDAIKKITLNNFNIIKKGNLGDLTIYRTSLGEKKYEYSEEYQINDSLVFLGDLNTNLKMEEMTISNQGGLLEFSGILNNLGKITYGENEDIKADGTLLQKLNLTTEDIKTEISFDMIIELSSGKTFKTTINLELPTGDIAENGVCTNEIVDINKFIYKRK